LWIKQAIQLRSARAKRSCHYLLGFALVLHGFFKLPSQYTLDRPRLNFLPDSFLFVEVVKSRPGVICDFLSFSFLSVLMRGQISLCQL
jgi:hypothetical protein